MMHMLLDEGEFFWLQSLSNVPVKQPALLVTRQEFERQIFARFKLGPAL